MRDKAGIEAIGFGSDFDGIDHAKTVHFLYYFNTKRFQTAQVFFLIVAAWKTN